MATRANRLQKPEFLRESFAVEDTLRPGWLVLGFTTEQSWAEVLLRQAFLRNLTARSDGCSRAGRPDAARTRRYGDDDLQALVSV
ncbi:hypothetical protein [Streptomyces sp. JV178]|uniref:hypothetical protein n=1 Tax=Streptomyces sp. JV178 TaxID=858632 RepID=UPI00117D5AC1|nr:hypothetical protein [Streptomyces sp. JV178]